jgi:hypothetical protein
VPENEQGKDRFNPVGENRPIRLRAFDENRYVFISHAAGTDPDLLRAIVRSLLRRNVSVWIYRADKCRLTDKELRGVRVQQNDPSEKWDKQVLDAVDTATVVLLLISKGSIGNEYQKIEIDRAIDLKKFITARVDDVSPRLMPKALEDDLSDGLNPDGAKTEVVASGVRNLADKVAKKIMGDAYEPVPVEGPFRTFLRHVHPIVWIGIGTLLILAVWAMLPHRQTAVDPNGPCPDGKPRYFGQCPT